ncbi:MULTISPECIES: hypothetical protein [Streptomyces]|uniref:Uncharacterized protein n=1 Tax=Streptomyces venezuelae TaxID=54571 RepID=A0A5P2AWS3_STRVZ|nr:hypothetical protein [Streptomyces venezuelae]QES22090.1 hypothetical protein DEJ46_25755 [Streptomyces venezuelae]
MSHEPRAASAFRVSPSAVEAARLRERGLIWAGLLAPAIGLAGLLALFSEDVWSCVMTKRGCGSMSGSLCLASLVIALAAVVTVQTTARPAVRRAAFRTQLGAEAAFLLLVLATFT